MRISARMKVVGAVLASLALAVPVLPSPPPAAAEGSLGEPRVTPAGTFGKIPYTQYDGIFEGRTSTGTYRVPYRITAPTNPARGNRTVLVEPPHFVAGLGTREQYLGQSFLFSRGFAHAGVGWSTATPQGGDRRILDPAVPGVFINGGVADGNGRTDDEIVVDFARALAGARHMLGSVRQQYVAGFSDSSEPVLRLIRSGRAAGVFDFALPFTTVSGHKTQAALAAGRFDGKLIVVNSEFDPPDGLVDRGRLPNQYRFYAVAGTGHIPDFLEVPFFSARSSPASFAPALRAHFLQGHAWVRSGSRPPPSIHLKTTGGGQLARDGNGNAIAVDMRGRPVPRLPFVELGEAHFKTGFLGSYDAVKSVAGLGFAGHSAYVRAYRDKLEDYAKAGYVLEEDQDAMLRRAKLCPPLTFTETYRDHYDAFVAIARCDR